MYPVRNTIYDLPPIQIVQKDGDLFSIDNRRLLAFNMAQMDKIPVEIVSLDDPAVLDRYQYRTDPILSQGNYVVVATQAERSAALDTLYEYNMIGNNYNGY